MIDSALGPKGTGELRGLLAVTECVSLQRVALNLHARSQGATVRTGHDSRQTCVWAVGKEASLLPKTKENLRVCRTRSWQSLAALLGTARVV